MTFERLWIINLIWVLPVFIFLAVIARRKKQQALELFADKELLLRLTKLESRSRQILRGIFILCAAILMIFALAGPRWGERIEEVTQKGVDIIVCMDVSQSMMVEDVKPNRLERAKREVVDLIRVIQGDRLGLVAFAGSAFLQCPLTLDYSALLMFLGQISPDLIPVSGTDLGDAIDVALASFDKKSATDKVILLITDGEDNEGRGFEAGQKAADEDIKIFVFGIGDPAGGPVPALKNGGFEKDEEGKLVLSKLNEQSLMELVSAGGDYVRSVDGDLDLDRLYFDGILKQTDVSVLKSGKIRIFEERFYIFLAAAFILLILEGFLNGKSLRNHS
ncbi:Ca-activated chloride channel homolog [Candidatus Magnetomoraceae bacterium gMMP-1]